MTDLYLLKSDHDRETIGDIIINLDKILTVRMLEDKGRYALLVDYTHEDNVRQWFTTKEACVQALKDLLSATGDDISIADDFVFYKRENKKDHIIGLLDDLKSKLTQAS